MTTFTRRVVSLFLVLVLFEDHSVVCSEIRLTGCDGYLFRGRLDIRIDSGDWVPMCDNNFDYVDATVACRQMGYDIASEDSYIAPGVDFTYKFTVCCESLFRFHMVNGCSGDEQLFTDCSYSRAHCGYHCCSKTVRIACLPRCPMGQYRSNDTDCIKCRAGHFQNEVGQTSCKACPPDHFNTEDGMNHCQACGDGQYAPEGSTTCKQCEPGTYTDSSIIATCRPCDVGLFQDQRGQGSCKRCLPGSYQTRYGSISCVACPERHTTQGDAHTNITACVPTDPQEPSFRNDTDFKYDCGARNPCIALVIEGRLDYPHSTPRKAVQCNERVRYNGVAFHQCQIINVA